MCAGIDVKTDEILQKAEVQKLSFTVFPENIFLSLSCTNVCVCVCVSDYLGGYITLLRSKARLRDVTGVRH